MNSSKYKRIQRQRRHRRVRARIIGSADVPRVAVFRSARHIYSQAIDDSRGETICAVNDWKVKAPTKTERSSKAGERLGELIGEKNIKRIVFDRGGFKYHGRVKALAEGLRKSGLKF